MTPLHRGLILIVGLALPMVLTAGEETPKPVEKPQPQAAVDQHGDPLPNHVRARLGTLRFRHGSLVTSVRFLGDGQSVMSEGNDRTLRIWDVNTGKQRHEFHLPGGNPFNGGLPMWVLSPDGLTLATGENDGTIRLWNVVTGKQLHHLTSPAFQIRSPAFSADGKHLAAVVADNNNGDGLVRIWEVATAKEVRSYAPAPPKEGQQNFMPNVCFYSANGLILGAVGNDNGNGGAIHLWDLPTGKEMPKLADHDGTNLIPIISPNGKLLADVGFNRRTGNQKLQLWETDTGKRCKELEGEQNNNNFNNGFFNAVFSPDSRTLAVIDDQQTLHLWDLNTGKALPPPANRANEAVTAAFSPDCRTIAIGSNNGTLHLCETATGKELHELKGYLAMQLQQNLGNGVSSIGSSLAFSPNGKLLVGVGKHNLLRVWSTASGQEMRPADGGHEGPVLSVALSGDGKWLATGSSDNTVRLWDRATGQAKHRVLGPTIEENGNAPGYTTIVAFTPDSKALAIGWTTGAIQLWDPATTKEIRQLKENDTGGVTSLTVAPDGKSLAAGYIAGHVLWWDVLTGQQIRRLAGPFMVDPNNVDPDDAGMSSTVRFSPDGRMLASVASDGLHHHVQVWELTTGKVRRQFKYKAESAGNPYGQQDDLVIVNGQVINSANNSASALLAFTPDSKMLACSSGTGIRLWDLARNRDVRQFGGQDSSVHGIAVTPTGTMLAAASGDGTIRLWDMATGTILANLQGHRGGVSCLDFTPDGQTLITGGNDTTVLLWDVKGALEAEQSRPKPLADRELAELWKQLAGEDSELGYDVITRLATAPQQVIPLLQTKVKPAAAADAQRITRFLADLENESFDVRKQAAEELEKLAELAEPFLRRRLAGNPPLEVRQRVDKLLEKLNGPVTDPDQVRARRAVEVLEQIGTPEAQAVLQELARGTPASRLTQDAVAALERLTSKR